jgi:hypothetical protein
MTTLGLVVGFHGASKGPVIPILLACLKAMMYKADPLDPCHYGDTLLTAPKIVCRCSVADSIF